MPRMDAVSYLSSALEVYRGLDLHGQKQLLPGQDAGIDFAREYELAKGLAAGESGGCWAQGLSNRR